LNGSYHNTGLGNITIAKYFIHLTQIIYTDQLVLWG